MPHRPPIRTLRWVSRLGALGLLVGLLALVMTIQPATWTYAAGPLDQSQESQATIAFAGGPQFLAQTFVAGRTGSLDQVDLALGTTLPPRWVPVVLEIRDVRRRPGRPWPLGAAPTCGRAARQAGRRRFPSSRSARAHRPRGRGHAVRRRRRHDRLQHRAALGCGMLPDQRRLLTGCALGVELGQPLPSQSRSAIRGLRLSDVRHATTVHANS